MCTSCVIRPVICCSVLAHHGPCDFAVSGQSRARLQFCWRRKKDIHGTVCVCDPSPEAEHATPSFEDVEQPAASWREQGLRTLGLWPEPPVTQHRVGIVSRLNKRCDAPLALLLI